MQKVKFRIGIWLIILALGTPMTIAAMLGEFEVALGLGGILGAVASKLVESEEKGQ